MKVLARHTMRLGALLALLAACDGDDEDVAPVSESAPGVTLAGDERACSSFDMCTSSTGSFLISVSISADSQVDESVPIEGRLDTVEGTISDYGSGFCNVYFRAPDPAEIQCVVEHSADCARYEACYRAVDEPLMEPLTLKISVAAENSYPDSGSIKLRISSP